MQGAPRAVCGLRKILRRYGCTTTTFAISTTTRSIATSTPVTFYWLSRSPAAHAEKTAREKMQPQRFNVDHNVWAWFIFLFVIAFLLGLTATKFWS
jgi:hypothetical protein